MFSHFASRMTKVFLLLLISTLLAGLVSRAAPLPVAWADAPGIWRKTDGVNEITPALTEGTATWGDDEAAEFVHPIQQWGAFGSQAFATAQDALNWVNTNITYAEDDVNYGVAEAWANPEQTLNQSSADCEDLAFLLASLLKWHTDEVKTGEGDLVYVGCGFVLPPAGAFHCWVIWYDASANVWHQLDPTLGVMNGLLYPALGTLWLNDAHVLGFLDGYYPGPLPPVGGYDTGDFARIAQSGFGDPMNNYPWSSALFQDDLYVGTGRNVGSLLDWYVKTEGLLPPGIELFAGVTRPTQPLGSQEWANDLRAEIWRLHDGAWERVYRSGITEHPTTGWVAEEAGFRGMIVYTAADGEQAIYAANGALAPLLCTDSLILKSTDGITWQRVVTPPEMGCDSRTLAIHNGKLYVAVGQWGRAQIWATDQPSTVANNWQLVADFTNHDPTNSSVVSLASFDGRLYAGTENRVTGFQVFKSDAVSPAHPSLGAWTRIISYGAGDMLNYWAGTMVVFKNHLYLGSMSWPIDFVTKGLMLPKGFDLFRIKPDDSWELLIGDYVPRLRPPGGADFRLPVSGWPGSFGNFLNLYCWSLVVDHGVLYLGTFDATTFLRLVPTLDPTAWVSLTEEQLALVVFGLEQVIGLMESHGVSQTFIDPYVQLLAALDVGDPSLIAWQEVRQILYEGFAGGDLWKTEDGEYWEPLTVNGFRNPNNYGVRNLVAVNPLFVEMSNPYQGAEIWRAPATIVSIAKKTDPGGGAGFQFTGDLGDFILGDGGSKTFSDPGAGDYDVTETLPPGWDLGSVICTGGNSTLINNGVTIHLDPGEDITCTFSNTEQSGSIKVCKEVVPDDASVWSFILSGTTSGAVDNLSNGQCYTWSDQTKGTYTLSEATQRDYDTTVNCGTKGSDTDNSISFTLNSGEDITCTFTNSIRRSTIIVEKQTDPHGAAGNFTFTGDAAGTISDGQQIVVSGLLPGIYTATEADPAPQFELTSITCNDGNSTGNVGTHTATFVVEAGETVKCTFSNARRSLQVDKATLWPLGGLTAVGQEIRYLITIENTGGLTVDPLTLRDEYDSWCLTSRKAQVPPDVHGGSAGFLQWNDLGALAPGETMTLWVEFVASGACEAAANRAIVETGGLTFQDEVTLRILETIAFIGGRVFHDETGAGTHLGSYRGVEGAQVSMDNLVYTTNTSGWYSFNLLDPGTYAVMSAPAASSWWVRTTSETCSATVEDTWSQVFCNFGYWWGLDGPPLDGLAAQQQVTLTPLQDTVISGLEPGNHGFEENLWVRQPGLSSTLLQFDLSGLPAGAQIVWARLRLYAASASNADNRLYSTAYPLSKMWTEGGATWSEAAAGLPWDEAGAAGAGDHGAPVGWAWTNTLGWVEFDLDPALVAAWLADAGSNHGLLLRGEGSENRRVAYWFLSQEHGNGAAHPQLVIGYNLP